MFQQKTRGSKRWLAAAGLTAGLALSGCGGGGGSSDGDDSSSATGACADFDCEAMLVNLADNVILPAYGDFQARAAELTTALQAWQGAAAASGPGSSEETGARDAARAAWDQAMNAWQQAEVYQLGPLVDNSSALRDSIYSWPSTNSCSVDQEVIFAEGEGDSYDISNRSPLRKGLDAIEYLVYTDSLDETCADNVTAVDGWNDRPDAERLEVRLDYLVQAGADLENLADELVARWDGTQDDFRAELTQPGTAGSRFDTAQDAVNAVSDALFYIEDEVKDTKLAEPLGIKSNECGPEGTICPEAVENYFSARSKAHIRTNLVAFQTVFLGNPADATGRPGFDDLLDTASGENTSAAMEADINDALAAIDNINGSLKAAVADATDRALVTDAQAAFKNITDRLKNDFLTVLGLSIPQSAAGDGD